ncbi:SDR family NAD(P)-dependent oxidoreductase [Microbacterium sp. SLBN-146]|uniref:SDR family NAD(P)-dependent oxidoreductase n=1 Tax=Microbacterium sp. SLBN-146 TaxID=2768457 RepID=UPI00114FA845|nr:SDR family NAD(P)-dependent oxidoreductase [Microbacterium sp. SLBN-146]TQJ31514.1 NADP-dependent 3-hydroxy acid dehydrogenase YdfG [Microbacterium sp. SLBN-146]
MPTIAIVGAGPGLGLAIAKAFGSNGFTVALVSRTQEKLDALASELSDAGIEAAGFAADVMDPASIAAAFDRIKERFGDVDVLEYSPAPHNPVPGLSNPTALQADRSSIQPQVDYYLYGGIAASEQVLPRMLERGSGTIIYTTGGSSMDPMAGSPEFTTTAIGSGALRTYALKLHQATAGTGVYVAHVPIFAWIGVGGPETQPDAIAQHYWSLYNTREGAERPYAAS